MTSASPSFVVALGQTTQLPYKPEWFASSPFADIRETQRATTAQTNARPKHEQRQESVHESNRHQAQ